MARPLLHKLLPLAVWLCPAASGQTPADMARILERLDRLERENRQLSERVQQMTQRLGGAAPGAINVRP